MTFTFRRQLTVALENEPGRLAEISGLLADAGLAIEGLCVVDNIDKGVARIISSDADECHRLLTDKGLCVVESEVLAVTVPNERGRLARVSHALGESLINIDYAYVTASPEAGTSLLIMKVSDLAQAEAVLAEIAGD